MELVNYQPQYDKLINDYYLPEEQLYYSAMPAEAVEISKKITTGIPFSVWMTMNWLRSLSSMKMKRCSLFLISQMIFYCARFQQIINTRARVTQKNS